MRDFNGGNSGTIIDNSTTIVYKNNYEKIDNISIEKEQTSIKKILIDKLLEVFVGGILAFITSVIGTYLTSDKSLNLKIIMHSILLGLLLLGIISSSVIIIAFINDVIHILQLRKIGKFVEFESKRALLRKVLNSLRSYDDKPLIRSTGKTYKNIDGTVFQIKTKKCPFCESLPIGMMKLVYDSISKEYIWVCSEQISHKIKFDYKKIF